MNRKAIFITGAGRGIGRATALLFAKKGWFTGLADINEEELNALADQLGTDNCSRHLMDVRDTEQVRIAIAEFGNRTGQQLNVLFNNAGIMYSGGMEQLSLEKHKALVDVNLIGLINVTHLALPMLKSTPKSVILSMCSASAIYGNPELTTYAATKSAVKSLTEGLSLLLSKHDIHVADLLPAYVRTDLVTDVQGAMELPDRDVKLTAEDIAAAAWRAVHSRKKHHYIGFDSNLFRFCKWLLPSFILEGILKATFYKRAIERN